MSQEDFRVMFPREEYVKVTNTLLGPYRGSQRDVVHLGWLIAPSYNEPKCGGRRGFAGSRPMSTAVHMEPKSTLESNSKFNPWPRNKNRKEGYAFTAVVEISNTSIIYICLPSCTLSSLCEKKLFFTYSCAVSRPFHSMLNRCLTKITLLKLQINCQTLFHYKKYRVR